MYKLLKLKVILTNIPEQVAVLAQHLQQLEDLGLPLAVLVAGMGVHNIVEAAGGPGPDGAGRSRRPRVLRVDMQQLYQQRDAPIFSDKYVLSG